MLAGRTRRNSFHKRYPIEALVARGDVEGVRALIDSLGPLGLSNRIAVVNIFSQSGSTPLFTSAWDGNLKMCNLLIKKGAKVNWKNVRGNTGE
jgi:ankyrin repeat protein